MDLLSTHLELDLELDLELELELDLELEHYLIVLYLACLILFYTLDKYYYSHQRDFVNNLYETRDYNVIEIGCR